MPLDPRVRRFLDSLTVGSARRTGDLTVAQRRESFARLLALGGDPPPIDAVAERQAPGGAAALRVRIYTPLGGTSERLPGLIFFHGGGLVAGSLDTHDGICRQLAQASGCRVLSVDYRLAPEARFPAALDDACAATRWVLGEAEALGLDPRRIGVGGDSAGATLAAAVCQALTAAGEGGIALQVLLCPILDYQAQTASRGEFAQGYLLDHGTLEHDLAHLLGPGEDPCDPRVSPLRAPALRGLPPACIHTAECDLLRDEGELYARRLQASDVSVRYRCHPGMIHLFYGLGAVIPQVAAAYQMIGTDIRALYG
jgi:acetyl esterase/lipase